MHIFVPTINPGFRFHKFLLFLGYPSFTAKDIRVNSFCKLITVFALEYRTTRERVLQQREKKASQRERRKTRGKMIIEVCVCLMYLKFCYL